MVPNGSQREKVLAIKFGKFQLLLLWMKMNDNEQTNGQLFIVECKEITLILKHPDLSSLSNIWERESSFVHCNQVHTASVKWNITKSDSAGRKHTP